MSREDYLEAILVLSEENAPVRSVKIAKYLNVSKPSVSQQIRRLREMGFVEHQTYGGVKLTPKGYEVARMVLRKHRILSDLLENVLGIPHFMAQRDACRMEHAMAPITAEMLRRLLIFVKKSPVRDELRKIIEEVFHFFCRSPSKINPDSESYGTSTTWGSCGRRGRSRLLRASAW